MILDILAWLYLAGAAAIVAWAVWDSYMMKVFLIVLIGFLCLGWAMMRVTS